MKSPFAYDRHAGMHGNLVQQNVAADPAGAASRRSERWALFECRQREREMGNEKNGADGPRVEVVVQDKEIRSSVFEDGALHLGVSSVDDSGADWVGLAFQLEGRITR